MSMRMGMVPIRSHTPSWLRLNVHGEPNRLGIRFADPVPYVARNRHMIALAHRHRLAAGKFQHGLAAQDHYPLILRLIIPKTLRAAVRIRDNALDAHIRALEQGQALFESGR